MPDDRLLKTLLFGMIDGERRPGRHARKWIDDILKWCGKDLRDAASTTEDRTKRKQFVAPTVHADHGTRRRRTMDEC